MATRKLDLDPTGRPSLSTSPPLAEEANVFSVDVEEYFHDETFR